MYSAPEGVLSFEKLLDVLSVSEEELKDTIDEYQDILNSPKRGIELVKVAGGYKLMTKNSYHEIIEKVIEKEIILFIFNNLIGYLFNNSIFAI